MRYLTVGEVLHINAAEAGEELLLDLGLVESAVARPQQAVFGEEVHVGIHAKAAALMHSLISNHAFLDGNKRAGVIAARLFYLLNGYELVAEQDAVVELAMGVAEGRYDVEDIAPVLESWAREAPRDEDPSSRASL